MNRKLEPRRGDLILAWTNAAAAWTLLCIHGVRGGHSSAWAVAFAALVSWAALILSIGWFEGKKHA